MKSKLALLLATLLFFNIILPIRVSAATIQDQSKPIFGLTADQVVEKYNQLSDQQKDQVLRSLGNTSVFANSLFGNIFNSTFGALDDAIEKIGDLFFQANGVIYKLGSSALAWISRLIDKVFNNNLNDLNISQPVINDLFMNTRYLSVLSDPLFINGHKPTFLDGYTLQDLYSPYPDTGFDNWVCYGYYYGSYPFYRAYYILSVTSSFPFNVYDQRVNLKGLFVDYDSLKIGLFGYSCFTDSNSALPQEQNFYTSQGSDGYWNISSYTNLWNKAYGYSIYDWSLSTGYSRNAPPVVSFTLENLNSVFSNYLNTYYNHIDTYYVKQNGHIYLRYIDHGGDRIDLTNNTYYNYIYNIPDQTPLNVTNIVSNTAINYDPVENLIQYLPDNYNIEQNFSVVNNYYISSGSAISGQAIDVNLVSPGVIDVRVINPEDLTQQEINNVSKDIINNYDVDINASDLTSTITIVKDTAVNNLNDVAPSSGSSIGWVKNMFLVIPSDLMKILLTFLIVGIIVCVYHSR